MADISAIVMSLRESARRFIKLEGCMIFSPDYLSSQISDIIEAIPEFLPARINFPNHSIIDDDVVRIIDLDGNTVAQLSGDEPELGVSWTAGNLKSLFPDFKLQVSELLAAGYPGCEGCGGPGSTGDWDEETSRDLIKNSNSEI